MKKKKKKKGEREVGISGTLTWMIPCVPKMGGTFFGKRKPYLVIRSYFKFTSNLS